MQRTVLVFLALFLAAGLAAAQTPTALAENYGIGSVQVNSSTPGAIAMPAGPTVYTGNTRGYFFTAPCAFLVTGLQVPDLNSLGYQNVALYRLQAAPPAYSGTIMVTPVFFQRWAPSNTFVPVLPPVAFNKGDVFAVLGACSANNATSMVNAYSSAQPSVDVGGTMTTLYRCGMQFSIAAASGNGANGIGPMWSEIAGSIAQVAVNIVVYQTPFPRLDTSALPVLGTKAQLDLTANIPSTTVGLVALGVGRVNYPTALGPILAGLPWFATFSVPGGTGPLVFGIPNNSALLGGLVNWQGFAITPANFGTSNGVEWRLGI